MIDRKLDLLLINPGGRRSIYQNLGDHLSAKEPPIWVGMLAQYARKKGLSVEILDANALDLGPAEVAAAAAALRPLLTTVVVYGHNPNASTHVMPGAGEICRELVLADPCGRVLLVGGHVSALPERTLYEESADFVCSGEGPATITQLVAALRADRERPELAKVQGLVWRDGDWTQTNAAAPLVTRLDEEMPGLAWDLLPMQRYRAHNWHCFGGRSRQPYAALYTTLGCPFHCTFCCIQAPFKSGEKALGYEPTRNSYRRWSPALVVSWIERLVREHGVSNLKIADELFVLHKGHVAAICDGLIALGADLNIWAYARVDTCADERLLEKMARAGFRWLAIGIESASEHVRADVEKGYKPEGVAKAIETVRRSGIHVLGNYIFGLPEDDLATMQQTLDFAKQLNTEYANFFSAMAYPGSQLYRDAVARGWPLPVTWNGYSQHSRSCLPLPTRHLSGPEVLRFRDAAFQRYFDRPEYRAMLAREFGEQALAEVRQMVLQPLVREHVPSGTTLQPA